MSWNCTSSIGTRTARSEQVTISNAGSGAVLVSQTVSYFHNGVYLDFAVDGDVTITFTQISGYNAVLSGIFFDPASTDPQGATATFAKADSTTEGNWSGVYGSQGYDVISNAQRPPQLHDGRGRRTEDRDLGLKHHER